MKPSKSFVVTLILTVAVVATGAIISLSRARIICTQEWVDVLLEQTTSATLAFRFEMGEWPTALADLTNNAKGIRFADWDSEGQSDPWGNPLLYIPYNTNTGCGLVISWGADGEPGGKKQDRDRVVRFR